ncbi:hypothetical protein DPEC_G00182270 [Dallia pectoralis]|uniref:Uncharacterized protein n=1 Tax=Dallia pectoralis TaxID=75939 RepID=A0ACC2GAR4_DALPE|nr:hypothetical protein DPEC_G00182270 [Dallia pectoralis]
MAAHAPRLNTPALYEQNRRRNTVRYRRNRGQIHYDLRATGCRHPITGFPRVSPGRVPHFHNDIKPHLPQSSGPWYGVNRLKSDQRKTRSRATTPAVAVVPKSTVRGTGSAVHCPPASVARARAATLSVFDESSERRG